MANRYAFFLVLLASGLLSQEPTIRTSVPLVVVPVSVTDRNGQFLYDLTAADFSVLDDGQPRPVNVEGPDSLTTPFNLVVLVQTSDISDSALLKIKKVGTLLQDAVAGANGATAVVTFADDVKVIQDFSSNDGELAATFRGLKSAESREGRMLDAVAKSLDLLANRPKNARSAVLIIGESKDRGSETKWRDLLPVLQRSGVTIYSLAYSAFLTPLTTKASEYSPPESGRGWILDSITEAAHATRPDTCKLLVAATGGRQLQFQIKSKLENDLIRLGGDMHSRYVVSFAPSEDATPGFHKITVEIRSRPDLHVDSRAGYWLSAGSAR